MTAPLARRYRRLLWSYPPGERRQELLDTLLESAPPDRRRPTPREVGNLLRFGLRARLGRPASRGVLVFAVLVALACGFVGAAQAARLAWQFAPPPGAESDALSRTVFPGLSVLGGGDAPLFVATSDNEALQYGYADYWVKHTAATRDLRAYPAGVRDRLTRAGWRIHEQSAEPGTGDSATSVSVTGDSEVAFWADRDGLILTYSEWYRPDHPAYDSDGAAAFQLYRAGPPWVPVAAGLGAVLGALIGWLLTGWVSRRTEGRWTTAPVAAAAGPALLLMVPALLYALPWPAVPGTPPVTPGWLGLAFPFDSTFFLRDLVAGALWLGLGVLLVAALPARRPRLRAVLRRRTVLPAAAVVLLALLTTAVWHPGALPAWAGDRQCTPSAPPAEPADTRLSRFARVFVSPSATADQRNLLEAAIHRVYAAGASSFNGDPTSPEFRAAYCGEQRLPPAVGRTLPWFWNVELSSPGGYDALVAEVQGMPGLVGVRHARPDR